jgi:hypothetical protein
MKKSFRIRRAPMSGLSDASWLRDHIFRIPTAVSSIFSSVSEAEDNPEDDIVVDDLTDNGNDLDFVTERLAEKAALLAEQTQAQAQQAIEEAQQPSNTIYYVLGAAAVGGLVWYLWK